MILIEALSQLQTDNTVVRLKHDTNSTSIKKPQDCEGVWIRDNHDKVWVPLGGWIVEREPTINLIRQTCDTCIFWGEPHYTKRAKKCSRWREYGAHAYTEDKFYCGHWEAK